MRMILVFPDSLNRLVSVMIHDSKVMGLCGETLISNEKESWITMIQVYEYFISHRNCHLELTIRLS